MVTLEKIKTFQDKHHKEYMRIYYPNLPLQNMPTLNHRYVKVSLENSMNLRIYSIDCGVVIHEGKLEITLKFNNEDVPWQRLCYNDTMIGGYYTPQQYVEDYNNNKFNRYHQMEVISNNILRITINYLKLAEMQFHCSITDIMQCWSLTNVLRIALETYETKESIYNFLYNKFKAIKGGDLFLLKTNLRKVLCLPFWQKRPKSLLFNYKKYGIKHAEELYRFRKTYLNSYIHLQRLYREYSKNIKLYELGRITLKSVVESFPIKEWYFYLGNILVFDTHVSKSYRDAIFNKQKINNSKKLVQWKNERLSK